MIDTPRISPRLRQAIRLASTGALLVGAGFATRALWTRYEVDPWTRDGRVRADVVEVAPDVAGLVTQVYVANDQPVHRGDLLFQIDRERYALALRQADAALAQARAAVSQAGATLAEARREARRNHRLGDLVPLEVTQQSDAKVQQGEATLDAARSSVEAAATARDTARLNLERTQVRASTDGVMSDMTLRVGNYVSPGKPVMALIDSSSLRVEGYFEETKLPFVHVGQKAVMHVMGETQPLRGHVVSIAAAIEDRDRTGSSNLLPNINPSFSWVRLAQRVPVRIAIDERPKNLALIAGRTATVTLEQPRKAEGEKGNGGNGAGQ